MRIIQITPGSGGGFYCENCLRDITLVKAMRKLGHDVIMVPLYLPLQPEAAGPVSNAPIFFGGVNVYLQQKLGLFRKTPRWIDKIFDSPRILRWAARKTGLTGPAELGRTTISMLRGEQGRQLKELDRLVDWLDAEENKADIICLSNILLAGLVGRIKQKLDVPVICLLQDEHGFLDGLPSPYSEQAWEIVTTLAKDIDAFVAVSKFYADFMQQRLALDPDRIKVCYVGISLEGFEPRASEPDVPTIGFLSQTCVEKGLDTLVEAFITVKKNEKLKEVRLRIAGGHNAGDET
ncbi:MAG: glycosyltransferase, partial [Planctomycetota bacterium]